MKPYNSEIIKAMAAHSDECAAYASAMKWDYWRRQKVENVTKTEIIADCGFCYRYDRVTCSTKDNCLLKQKDSGKICREGLFSKVIDAFNNRDQQAFTENANNLYFQIRSIIDDFYKPGLKKEEVFYKIRQKFNRTDGHKYMIIDSASDKVAMLNLDTGGYCAGWHAVKDTRKITQEEFETLYMKSAGTFTLIESKK